jgi:hypothetical protein
MDLKIQVRNYLLKEREARSKKKDAFWPSETEGNIFDIYHGFKGTLPTNPMTVETQFALGMRKKLEEAVVEIFGKMNILVSPASYTNREGVLIEKPDQHRVEITRMGIKINGYMDAIVRDDGKEVPVEIKTSYGSYSKNDLLAGHPKVAYLKQLAIYMDSLGVNLGYLFVVNFERDLIIDDVYQFPLVKIGDIFKCGDIEFNLEKDVYARWKMIWDTYIVPDIEPVSEYRYKYDVKTIDWKRLPASRIANARNNKAVIGDWQILYSSYKDLLIQKEGTEPGYDENELEYIKKCTSGYTTWNRK